MLVVARVEKGVVVMGWGGFEDILRCVGGRIVEGLWCCGFVEEDKGREGSEARVRSTHTRRGGLLCLGWLWSRWSLCGMLVVGLVGLV